jgi:Cdc25 family phosphatase
MSSAVPFISASELSALILTPDPAKKVKVIDVRDHGQPSPSHFQIPLPPNPSLTHVRHADHIGGHILNSTHQPSTTFSESLPELVKDCEDANIVVFHCALSQQRGPTAARAYARARTAKDASTKASAPPEEEPPQAAEDSNDKTTDKKRPQEVYVLERGFVGWQEVYGNDKRLTEGYVADLWKDEYL